jgi:hypothetical protein
MTFGVDFRLFTRASITDNETIVITVYEPEQGKWSPNFKRRIP